MASYNKVILMGNLTKDPQSRQTPGGTSVCSFTLAVSRKFTSNGQPQEETCFVDITAFNKTADVCGKFLTKGSPVMIEGRLKLDQWQDKNSGENRQKLGVMAESVQLLGRKDDNGNRDNGQAPKNQSRGVEPQYAPPAMPEDNCDENDDIPF